jgi:iron complex transport system substrate-binding protein
VYFEVGGGPHAAGASSFIGQTLARLGLDNVAPAGLGPFPALNPEFVVRANPDVVIGVATEAAALARRPGWREIAALRPAAGAGPLGARQCALPSSHYETVIRPGPRLGEAAWILADCLARLPGAAAVLQSTASGR